MPWESAPKTIYIYHDNRSEGFSKRAENCPIARLCHRSGGSCSWNCLWGAPLFGKNGEAIGSLSISSHLEKILESSQIENLARSLLATSGEISRALQYS
jgi:hypothetical protein